MRTKRHDVDFCVVGGGMAGLIAAVAAARRGVKTLLMHDRPVLGGNASSEIRMFIGGASSENADYRETGILEEILLENRYRNTYPNYSVWDSVLYGLAMEQPNLITLLNCSCRRLEMDGMRIRRVEGWQLTTEIEHVVDARYFADCSGDGILAPLSEAEFRIGRESRREFDESIEPEEADDKRMGMSCLIQAREYSEPKTFIPPAWARIIDEEPTYRNHDLDRPQNFWYLELGGTRDTIHDTEEIRHELLKLAFGMWDHIKNRGDHHADNWALDWVGFLPGKRESRRYVGDHILTQNDIAAGGVFPDVVGFGGWTMDDHTPDGFDTSEKPNDFHPAPCPYGIPYRCLYSRNVENLFFAGRDISCTHAAMSSTRVMATCSVLGQAVGTAASLAVANDLTPRGVYENEIERLRRELMEEDCFLPGTKRVVDPDCLRADLTSSNDLSPEPLRDGIDRTIGDESHCWNGRMGDSITLRFAQVKRLDDARIVFDSWRERSCRNMRALQPLEQEEFHPPAGLVKSFHLEIDDGSGNWREIHRETNNYQRLVRFPVAAEAVAARLTLDDAWGEENVKVFAFEVR